MYIILDLSDIILPVPITLEALTPNVLPFSTRNGHRWAIGQPAVAVGSENVLDVSIIIYNPFRNTQQALEQRRVANQVAKNSGRCNINPI